MKLKPLDEEVTTVFSKDDINSFKKGLERIDIDNYENMSRYEAFLLSVGAINYYLNAFTDDGRITVASYHDEDIEKYFDKFVSKSYPMQYDSFAKLSRPMVADEDKRKRRWIRDRFVPRAFWDELYKVAK
jgi:hypothetical protein